MNTAARLQLLVPFALALFACATPQRSVFFRSHPETVASVPVDPPPPAMACRWSHPTAELSPGWLLLPTSPRPFAWVQEPLVGPGTLTRTRRFPPEREGHEVILGHIRLVVDRSTESGRRLTPLYLSRPLQPNAVIEWAGHIPLELESVDGDGFQAALGLPPHQYEGPERRHPVTCGDISLWGEGTSRYSDGIAGPDIFHGDPRSPLDGHVWMYRADVVIPVSEVPGGPPLDRFTYFGGAFFAHVLERRDGFARIDGLAGFDGARARGWVPESTLVRGTDPGPEEVYPRPTTPFRRDLAPDRPGLTRCKGSAPLALRIDGLVSPVGSLEPGAAYEPGRRVDGFVELTLAELDGIQLEPGVAWVVREADLAACAGPPSGR